jgi:hypothetical protein
LTLLVVAVVYTLVRPQQVSWNNLTDIPPSFADGVDNDTNTLGDLNCSTSGIARWNGTAWECAPDTASLLPDCLDRQYLIWDKPNNQWICGGTAVPLGSQAFDKDGTFVVPDGVTELTVELWGGGGGGGGSITTCGNRPIGRASGGGSGGYLTTTISVTPGERYTVIIGMGGDGGMGNVGSATDGVTGGNTQFVNESANVFLEATGGQGGGSAACTANSRSSTPGGVPDGNIGLAGRDGGKGGIGFNEIGNGGEGGSGSNGTNGNAGKVVVNWY